MFAHRPDATVVAEGIETQSKLQTLKVLEMVTRQGVTCWATYREVGRLAHLERPKQVNG